VAAVIDPGAGKVWWFPIGSEDHVRLTEDVMSYEHDGELRLAGSIGEVISAATSEDVDPDAHA
jgi:hypothetical protein